tara:strand:- start:39 stop:743 length:705 start_codon:yes stop_codon:yes gene_type:complete
VYKFFRSSNILYIIHINLTKNFKKKKSLLNLSSALLELIIILLKEMFFEITTKFKYSNTREIQLDINDYKANRRPTLFVQISDTNKYLKNRFKNLNNFSALDIGCGNGKILYLVNKLNFKKIYGVELNKFYFKECEENLKNYNNIKILNDDFFNYKIDKNVKFFFIFTPFANEEQYKKFVKIIEDLPYELFLISYGGGFLNNYILDNKKSFELIFKKTYIDNFYTTHIFKKERN